MQDECYQPRGGEPGRIILKQAHDPGANSCQFHAASSVEDLDRAHPYVF